MDAWLNVLPVVCAVALLRVFCFFLRCVAHEEIEELAFDVNWLRLQQNRYAGSLVVDVCWCVQAFFLLVLYLGTGKTNPPEGVVLQGLGL